MGWRLMMVGVKRCACRHGSLKNVEIKSISYDIVADLILAVLVR